MGDLGVWWFRKVSDVFGIVLRCQKGQSGALAGELYPRHEKQTKNPAETTGNRYKIVILMGADAEKLKGLAAASLGLKTFDDNPYVNNTILYIKHEFI